MAFKLNKKVLCHTGAGVAAVILMAFGISQCNGKSAADSEREAAVAKCDSVVAQRDSVIAQATDVMKQARSQIENLRKANSDLTEVNEQQGDSIVVLNDSIGVLNDSIVRLNDQLVDCQGRNRRAPAKPVNKKPAQGGKKKQPVARQGNDDARGTVVVRDSVRKREVTVPVATPGGNNVIVNGDNSGQIIINNGGVVNSCNADKKANAAKAAAEQKVVRDTCVLIMRSRYVKRY